MMRLSLFEEVKEVKERTWGEEPSEWAVGFHILKVSKSRGPGSAGFS